MNERRRKRQTGRQRTDIKRERERRQAGSQRWQFMTRLPQPHFPYLNPYQWLILSQMDGITKQWSLVKAVFLAEMVQYRIEFSQSRLGWSAIRERFRNNGPKWPTVRKTIGQCLQYCRCLAVADPEFTRCDVGRSGFYIDERRSPRVSGSSPKPPANRLCEVGYNP